MSRKQSLAKKIAHTLMAMSIVYSSGINIVVNQVYAAETKNLTNSDSTFSKVGTGGNNYYQPGGVTDGERMILSLILKVVRVELMTIILLVSQQWMVAPKAALLLPK